VTDGLALLPQAVPSSLPAPTAGTRRLRGEALIRPIDGHDVAASFERQRSLAHVGLHAGMSYWWTVGGPDFPALALTCPGLPDPYLFTGLLTGQFDADAV
jgi:type VI secretion system protein ImpM